MPNSYARWGDLQIDASLIVAGIGITLVYAGVRVDATKNCTFSPVIHYVYPVAAIDIQVTYGIRINRLSGNGMIERTWIDPPSMIPTPIAEGVPGVFPSIGPAGNRIVYADEDGTVIDPPTHFAWRGLLGRLTDPSSDSERRTYELPGDSTGIARALINAVSNVHIGGQPALLETNPARPNQLWAGKLLLTFEGTSGYADCMRD